MNTGVSRSFFFGKRRFLHESAFRDNARVVFARGYGYLLWAVFRKTLFHAKTPSRRGKEEVFLSDSASLREKLFHAKTPSRKGGYGICGKNAGADIATFSIPQAVLPGIVGRLFIRPYTWNWGVEGGTGPERLSESGFSGF
jgi:hypothetical protein